MPSVENNINAVLLRIGIGNDFDSLSLDFTLHQWEACLVGGPKKESKMIVLSSFEGWNEVLSRWGS